MKDLSITYEYGMTMYISGGFFPPEGKILPPSAKQGGGDSFPPEPNWTQLASTSPLWTPLCQCTENDVCDSVYVILNNIPSASGGLAPRPPPGLRPWTPLGDFRPRDPLVAPLAKIPAGAHWGPHIFSEQGPVLSKSGPDPS